MKSGWSWSAKVDGNGSGLWPRQGRVFIASISNKRFRQYYTNKLQGREKERGIKTKMRVKLAAKMALIAWTMMKKEEPFNPDLLNLQ